MNNSDDDNIDFLMNVYSNLIINDDDGSGNIASLIEMAYLRGRLESLTNLSSLSGDKLLAYILSDLSELNERIALL